jgi:hypothetical protein
MLIDLKPRVSEFGEWQDWVKTNLKISHETVSLYMRFAKPDNLAKILAAGKSASVADLKMTITEAAKVIAKKSKPKGEAKPKNKNAQAAAAVEPGDTKASAPSDPYVILNALDARDIFDNLKHDADKLSELYKIIGDHYRAAGEKFKRREFTPA